MSIPNDISFTPFDQLPASSLNDLVENDKALADASAIDDKAISDAKLENGKVYRRQGGNATNWAVAGTNNYDVSEEEVIVQTGVVSSGTGGPATVTFPVAFSEKPVVMVSTFGGNAGDTPLTQNAFAEASSVTTTTVQVLTFNTSGTQSNQAVAWIAIGKK